MNDHTPDTVGVDISKAHLDVHRRSTGESARFANAAAGFEELAAWVGDSAALVVYESTGPWHRQMEENLAGRLLLARVNALRARRFAQAMGEEAKTDAVDARRDGGRGGGAARGAARAGAARPRRTGDGARRAGQGPHGGAEPAEARAPPAAQPAAETGWRRSAGRSRPWTTRSRRCRAQTRNCRAGPRC